MAGPESPEIPQQELRKTWPPTEWENAPTGKIGQKYTKNTENRIFLVFLTYFCPSCVFLSCRGPSLSQSENQNMSRIAINRGRGKSIQNRRFSATKITGHLPTAIQGFEKWTAKIIYHWIVSVLTTSMSKKGVY